MALDQTKLQNVKKLTDGAIRARCPACAAAGKDTSGEHLKIYSDGRYACAANQGDKAHRKEIFRLVGIPISGAAHSGLISVNTLKIEASQVVMDLSDYSRFSRKPRTKG